MESSVLPLTELDARQSARVAYVNGRNDQRIQKMDVLQIRPGAQIRVLQKYPCHVIECEGGNIAMDSEVASCIFVWRRPE
ncbi:MAG: ferrous iron transport protein A [Deltaproteobacteria bacterium]|nr:ferrous iron transport protein A [Deltaproteobacteria bacterium]